MAAIVPVYCEFEQLKKIFFRKFNDIQPSQEKIAYDLIKRMLLSDAFLMWDLNNDEVLEISKSDILVKTIIKKSTSGGCEFTDEANTIIQLKSNPEYHLKNDESTVYLIDETDKIGQKYASFIFHEKHHTQIEKSHHTVSKGKSFIWSTFLGDYLCSRYLFIQDNYLIENITKEKTESFIEIIKAFISKEYVGKFDLYILHFIEDETLLKIKKNLIQKIIIQLGLDNVSVHYRKGRKEDLHDRIFVTNYCVMTSGHGTDFLNKGKSTRDTTLTYCHIAQYPEFVKQKQEVMFAFEKKYR